jgi:DNA-directed RNA polymerase specialized sigma24 family protein
MSSDTLTIEQIRAAQNSDLTATEAVVAAMESRIQSTAASEARRMKRDMAYYTDEFAQEARIAVWEALPRFVGETVDEFFAFMHTTLKGVVKEAASDDRNAGCDRDSLKVFAAWVKRCDGDVTLAEKMCQTVPPEGGRRLGRDRAHAARLAWQNVASLDAVLNADDDSSTDVSFANMLASSIGIPEEFLTSGDLSAEDKRQNIAMVHAVLDSMGTLEATVLRGNFGIGGAALFGYERGNNQDAEFAAAIGKTDKQVATARAKGFMSFAKRYIPVVTDGDADAAESWWDAYKAERARFRRPTAA